MKPPPRMLGEAKVILWSVIDDRHRSTGSCRHIVAGEVQGPAAALAICQHVGEVAYYLFGCDDEWCTVTDSWHLTLNSALQQAAFEYEGVSATWSRLS